MSFLAGEWNWQWGHRPSDILCVLQSPHQPQGGAEAYGEMLCQGQYMLFSESIYWLLIYDHLNIENEFV